MSKKKTAKLNRRDFVKTLPAAGAAGLTLASGETVAQPQQAQTPQKITKETLHTAEQLIGIELTERGLDLLKWRYRAPRRGSTVEFLPSSDSQDLIPTSP